MNLVEAEYIRILLDRVRKLEYEMERLNTVENVAPETMGVAGPLASVSLRGYWPMSSVDENMDVYDLSGQSRLLTAYGTPLYNYDNLAPYIDMDGINDYLARADEAGLDIAIAGADTHVTPRGLTVGGWFWNDFLATNTVLMSKGDGGVATTHHWLERVNTNTVKFRCSDGAALQGPLTSTNPGQNTWYHAVGRFVPSTSIDVFVNNQKWSDTVGIPANLQNNAVSFCIGTSNLGARKLDGRASMCFLVAAALSDKQIAAIFELQRGMFLF